SCGVVTVRRPKWTRMSDCELEGSISRLLFGLKASWSYLSTLISVFSASATEVWLEKMRVAEEFGRVVMIAPRAISESEGLRAKERPLTTQSTSPTALAT